MSKLRAGSSPAGIGDRATKATGDRAFAPRLPLDSSQFDGLSDAAILNHYLRQVKAWRGTQKPRGFRENDVQILIGILGTDARTIEKRLLALTGCQPATAKLFRRLLVLGIVGSTGVALAQGIASANTGGDAIQYRQAVATGSVSLGSPTAAPTRPVVGAVATKAAASAPKTAAASAPKAAATASATGGGTVVSLTVEPYAEVRVDQAGNPTAVRTNTGRAPTVEDPWFVAQPQQAAAVALEAGPLVNRVIAAVSAATAHADWEPGTWYSLDDNQT